MFGAENNEIFVKRDLLNTPLFQYMWINAMYTHTTATEVGRISNHKHCGNVLC